MKPPRPDSVSFIGQSQIIIAPLGLLFAIFSILLSVVATSAIFSFFSLIWLVSGLGLLKAKPWSWNFSMGTAILSLMMSLFFFRLFSVFIFIFGAGLIYWTMVIYKLTGPEVKNFLGKGIASKAPSQTPTINSS